MKSYLMITYYFQGIFAHIILTCSQQLGGHYWHFTGDIIKVQKQVTLRIYTKLHLKTTCRSYVLPSWGWRGEGGGVKREKDKGRVKVKASTKKLLNERKKPSNVDCARPKQSYSYKENLHLPIQSLLSILIMILFKDKDWEIFSFFQ